MCCPFSVLRECHCLHMWARYTRCEVLLSSCYFFFHMYYSTWFLLTSWKDFDSHTHLPVHPSNSSELLLLSLVVFPWCWYRGHFLARLPSYREPAEFPTQSWRAFPMAWWRSVVLGLLRKCDLWIPEDLTMPLSSRHIGIEWVLG